MSDNPYYQRIKEFDPRTRANGLDVEFELDAISAAFDKIPAPRDDGQGYDGPIHVGEAILPTHAVQLQQMEAKLGDNTENANRAEEAAERAEEARDIAIEKARQSGEARDEALEAAATVTNIHREQLEKALGVNARVYPRLTNQNLKVGDVIPAPEDTADGLPITHVIVDGNAYAMSPLVYGLVEDLTATSAIIGGVVVLLVGDGDNGLYDLSDFGAVYDGTSDETLAIKNAMNASLATTITATKKIANFVISPSSGFIPLEKSLKGLGVKTVFKRYANSAGNMFIYRDGVRLEDLVVDGNALENPSGGTSVRAENRSGIGMRNVSLINAGGDTTGDGFYAKGVTNATFENVLAVGNGRNGASFVDDCRDLSFRGWRTKNNGLVGLDLEPNSTTQSNISIVDYQSDNDGLSIQGGASTAYNSKITLDNIRILNGSLLNINRAVGLNGGTIYVDFTSEITIEKQASAIYGLTDGNVNIIKEGVPLNAQNAVLNGSFNGAGSGWSVVKSGSSVVEFIKQANAVFGSYVLHTIVSDSEFGQAKSQEFDVVASQYFCCGCHIRAVFGRPYLALRFKNSSGTVISTHKLAGPVNPENRFRRPFMMFRVPDGAVKADILCGGDASEPSEGYFDGVFYYQNSTKSLFDPSDNDVNNQTFFGVAPPTFGFFEAGWRHYPTGYVESGSKPVMCWIRKTTGSNHVVGVDWVPVIGA